MPQLEDRGQVFVGHPAALAERDTEGVELVLEPATPTVICARPPLNQSSVANCLAATIGWCSGRIVTIDPMVIVEVTPAT